MEELHCDHRVDHIARFHLYLPAGFLMTPPSPSTRRHTADTDCGLPRETQHPAGEEFVVVVGPTVCGVRGMGVIRFFLIKNCAHSVS